MCGIVDQTENLARDGYVVLDGLYPPNVIADARKCIIDNIELFKNTRPNPGSGHLAGFHRHPRFEQLHGLVAVNEPALAVLREATGSAAIRSIGLSDITINRSQQWHVDLLRGKYRRHLEPSICWGKSGGGLYKVLLYLQPGNSLKVVPGAHTKPIALDSDRESEPQDGAEVRSVEVESGALVVMDIRLPHCGSTEDELSNPDFLVEPKMLVTTVLGDARKPLTQAMETGNMERMRDWDELYENQARVPRLSIAMTVDAQ